MLRRHPVWTGFGVLALIALGVAVFYRLIDLHPCESTDDAFVDARSHAVAPKAGGYVTEVAVTDNQRVEAGAKLFLIDRPDYRIAVERADAQIDPAEAALRFVQEDADRHRTLAQRGAGTIQPSQSSTSNRQQQATRTRASPSGSRSTPIPPAS